MLKPQIPPRYRPLLPRQRLIPPRRPFPTMKRPRRQKQPPILPQNRRHKIQIPPGAIRQIRLKTMKQRIRIFRRYFWQIPHPLPQQLVIIRRLRHKRQHIPVIRRQRRGHFPPIPPNPVQFRPLHHRKPAPIRMHQFMHHPDGLSLPRPGPRTEPVTPEKPRLPPHLPEIQTPQQRRPRRRRPV